MAGNNNYKKYLTGLKGFACVMVMIGHFLGVFTYANSMPVDIHYFIAFRESRLGFVLNESFWLYLFFVVSGYLLAFSRIEKLYQLFAKMIQRFLRLGLPVLFAYVIIFIVYITIGFHNGETVSLFDNARFQKPYSGEYTFLTVLMSPIDVLIFGECSLNTPYWVLREMFVASLIIYTANYFFNKFSSGNLLIKTIIVLGLLFITLGVSYLLDSKVVIFCLLGAALGWSEKNMNRLIKTQWFYAVVLLMIFSLTILDKSYMQQMFFLGLIVCVPRIHILHRVFSSLVFGFMGKISFGTYSFHWPAYCSIGSLIMLNCTPQCGLTASIIIAMIISVIVTMIFSVLFNLSCEKISGFITKKSYTILCKPFVKK